MDLHMTLKPIALICRPIGRVHCPVDSYDTVPRLTVLFGSLWVVVGFVYPAYASYKALETKTPEASAQWLTYWCVFSIFTVLEFFADLFISTIPLYYLMKLLFVMWLMAPQTKGATTLYVRFIMPLIKKHEESIDNALEQGYKKSENTFMDLKKRSLAFLREKGIYSGSTASAGEGGPVPVTESKVN